jgi:CBS domain containing-hemolysin-like protein
MNDLMFHWFILGFWLLVSFFLSGMETAVMSLNRLRLRQWLREGRPQARALLGYLDRPENFLWTTLVGNTIANFAAAWIVVTDLHDACLDRPWLFWTAFSGFVLGLYLLCELLPKQLFRRAPDRLASRLVRGFQIAHVALSPLVSLVESFAGGLLRWTGGLPLTTRVFGNRDELRAVMVDSGAALHPAERTLIGRVFDLQTRTVGQLARSLDKYDTVVATTPVSELLVRFRAGAQPRLPVWSHAGPDRRIIGVVSLRHVLYSEPRPGIRVAADLLRPAVYFDETTRLEDALRRMQRNAEHLAIVVDANRRDWGVITLGDILDSLFGGVL